MKRKKLSIAALFLSLSMASWSLALQAEDIQGMQVQNQQGKRMGTVEEIVMSPDGQIQEVVVERGGFLGLGGETNRIPWNALSQSPEGNYLVYDESAAAQAGAQQPGAEQLTASQADELMGSTLVGIDGSELGTVHMTHLAEDGESVQYLIIEGRDNRLHPVPAELVQVDEAQQQAISQIDEETFQNSPSFSPEQQPQLGQEQWTREINSYYGLGPEWQDRPSAPEPGQQQQRFPMETEQQRGQ